MTFWPAAAAVLLILVLGGLLVERTAEARDRRRFPPPGRLVPVGGGRALHLIETGVGPSVIVEQGAG